MAGVGPSDVHADRERRGILFRRTPTTGRTWCDDGKAA
jgi:hypothetical protein